MLPRSRRRLFRLVTVVLAPLLALALIEGSLRLTGYGYPTGFFRRGMAEGRAVLLDNDKFGWRFFGPDIARAPRPIYLPAIKPPKTVRIFVLGESAAFGDPQPEFGLPRMLEVLLRARWPERRFEVVNAAMTAINSHVLLPIARDCALADGDLWIIYMGNNEVVGPFGGGTVFGPQIPHLALIRASLALNATRTGQLLASLPRLWREHPPDRSEWQGMSMFIEHQLRQDDPRMARVYAHFERNLADILRVGRARGVKLVVSTVVSNLKDCPPFASMHRPNLTVNQTEEWGRLYRRGVDAEAQGKHAQAVAAFDAAGRIDDQFAELQFRWARCCLALGRQVEARQRFALARDADALRFRVDSRINDLIRRTARDRERDGVFLVDAEELLSRHSPEDLLGEELLYEHVHLNFHGNYALARILAEQVARVLPDSGTGDTDPGRPWLSETECARQLAWTDSSRYEAVASMLQRLNDPPFTSQLGHAERQQRMRQQMDELEPALKPTALREDANRCRAALLETPDDWVLHHTLARLLHRLGDIEGAAESCRQVIRLLPHSSEARVQLGVLLTDQGRTDEAIGHFDAALELKPGSVHAINGRGLALAGQGKDQAAIREYERALRLDPRSGEAHLNLGIVLSNQGKIDEAKRHFRLALERRLKKAEAMVALGKMCFSQGWINEAITNFSDALRIEPGHATAHFCLGGVLASVGQRVEARRHYAEAVRLNPDLAEARLGLGIELGRQGRDREAMEQFAEAVRLRPSLTEARLNLGIALRRQQRLDEALRQFQEALRLDPTNALARRYLDSIQPPTLDRQ
ncbi:MAG: tetratricopeptide repeat protein [Verrucomicrobia bacterium]|nr:tetratricopeptide repeat protein [Verrucomicrobiota bacterium]OQC65902.1 MAG: TPR repeat-containing protein YrrB [Verrucomicrobia bacterium ADurb.Bin006]MDI9381392.1 tetratricopeptide repeat protein [Verrucomicrobiota bacterium]NMD21610.1 tetratricopeptide repeat protein [Verrucomicrobiota bacterium]HOA62357.1 tetratricopeptide repeat protein [Verrucomicrobiota bacterium]